MYSLDCSSWWCLLMVWQILEASWPFWEMVWDRDIYYHYIKLFIHGLISVWGILNASNRGGWLLYNQVNLKNCPTSAHRWLTGFFFRIVQLLYQKLIRSNGEISKKKCSTSLMLHAHWPFSPSASRPRIFVHTAFIMITIWYNVQPGCRQHLCLLSPQNASLWHRGTRCSVWIRLNMWPYSTCVYGQHK